MDIEPLIIENEVMEFDMGGGVEDETTTLDLEHPDDDYEGDYNDELVEGSNPSTSLGFLNSNGEPDLEPYEGMEFDSEQAARIFIILMPAVLVLVPGSVCTSGHGVMGPSYAVKLCVPVKDFVVRELKIGLRDSGRSLELGVRCR
jgi:hypothetical protein